jgi:uncharacterized protein YcfL
MTKNINFTKRISIICCLAFMLTGCYTANKAIYSNARTPVYLKIANSKDYQFYVNGVAAEPKLTLYKRRLVSSSSNTYSNTTYTTKTYLDTYLPSLNVKANKPYVTIKQVSKSSGQSATILLKSNTAESFKIVMYFQAMFTAGIGNIIDFVSNSIYAWPILTATN